jgi:hypothetical protein
MVDQILVTVLDFAAAGLTSFSYIRRSAGFAQQPFLKDLSVETVETIPSLRPRLGSKRAAAPSSWDMPARFAAAIMHGGLAIRRDQVKIH